MGSKASKTLDNHNKREEGDFSNTLICDNATNKRVNLQNERSKNKQNGHNKNKYLRAHSNKASKPNAVEEEEDNVESDELLGDEGSNKTNFPQSQHLQAASSGDWVNYVHCVPFKTNVILYSESKTLSSKVYSILEYFYRIECNIKKV